MIIYQTKTSSARCADRGTPHTDLDIHTNERFITCEARLLQRDEDRRGRELPSLAVDAAHPHGRGRQGAVAGDQQGIQGGI